MTLLLTTTPKKGKFLFWKKSSYGERKKDKIWNVRYKFTMVIANKCGKSFISQQQGSIGTAESELEWVFHA